MTEPAALGSSAAQDAAQAPQLLDLPDEILLQVCSILGLDDKLRLSQTSHRLQTLLAGPSVAWREVEALVCDSSFPWLSQRIAEACALTLKSPLALQAGLAPVFEARVCELLGKATAVRKFRLWGPPVALQNLSHTVREIKLDCWRYRSVDLQSLSSLPQLDCLTIHFLGEHQELQCPLPANLPKCCELSLDLSLQEIKRGDSPLPLYTNLVHLALFGICPGVEVDLSCLAPLKRLQSLVLKSCRNVTCIPPLPALQSLRVVSYHDLCIHFPPGGLPRLRDLRLFAQRLTSNLDYWGEASSSLAASLASVCIASRQRATAVVLNQILHKLGKGLKPEFASVPAIDPSKQRHRYRAGEQTYNTMASQESDGGDVLH
ncbi:hypothetical protein WJX73_007958 [Symbiochloris irregularis]|uniref:F-box domain-containing protein n=1 Tax=Symbiochloris irregularis TaxID=706552 RepID=A0AAW1NTS8_9CHLO